MDSGNFSFELNELDRHLSLTYEILLDYFKPKELALKFYLKKNSDRFASKLNENEGTYVWQDKGVKLIEDPDHEYYRLVQFKVFVKIEEEEINIADGGFVDWTQKIIEQPQTPVYDQCYWH